MVEDEITHDSEGQIRDEDQEGSQEAFKEDEEIELARAEMRQVREENARLKMLLEKIEDDYKSLQMRFVPKKCSDSDEDENDSAPGTKEHQLVSLCLGRSCPSEPMIKTKEKQIQQQRFPHSKKEGDLKLCLNSLEDSKTYPVAVEVQTDPSPENSALLEAREEEEEGRETWPPNKALKVITSSGGSGDDDLSQAGVKRARVSVRTRCDTPTMNDGCQWRKYGQKIAKGNPCPRAYYRCTVAPSCPVRKQVQRCAEDMSILITTYEGMHNHPLPISATAMASTTSAAASMLLSGSSSTSQPSSSNLSSTLTGLNVNLSDNSKTRPYYLPNSSPPSYPTITLDLTNDPSTTSSQFNMFSSSSSHHQSTSRLVTSTRSLSFASSQPRVLSSSAWGSIGSLSYGANAIPYSKNHVMDSFQPGRTSQEHVHQLPFMQKDYQAAAPSQQALTESLTKAITSDPSFRSVIAAAITTMVGGGASTVGSSAAQADNNKVEGLGKMFNWDEQTTLGTQGKGCASSLQRASLRKQQPKGPQPSFSISNAAAPATTSENVEQTSRTLLE